MEQRVVDQDYLMLVFRDGEVLFAEDAKRSSAYYGHAFSEGDDQMVWFGKKVDCPARMHISIPDIPGPTGNLHRVRRCGESCCYMPIFRTFIGNRDPVPSATRFS